MPLASLNWMSRGGRPSLLTLVVGAFTLWAAASGSMAASKPGIEIKGGSERLRENVRLFLPLYDEACKTPRWRLRSLLRDSQRQIAAAAQALGYYHLTFEHDLTVTDDCWNMVITLTPGEPVRVTEIRIIINGEGNEDPAFQALVERPGIAIRDRLDHGKYETLKNRFPALAATRGYFDGKFEHSRVAVNTETHSATVELVYNTGVRYRIGDINLQQDILRDEFVERYINIAEGDYYDSDALLELKTLYNSSNFFSSATITPNLQDAVDGTVPIDIILDPRKRHSYSVGAGFATDTGPRFLLGIEDRYINSRGHSVRADLSVSDVITTFEAAYNIPMTRPAKEALKLYYGYERENTEVSLSEVNQIGVSYTRLGDNDWLYTYALNYQLEDSVKGEEEKQRTNLLIPSVGLSRIHTVGDPSYPQRGWSLTTRLSGSPNTLGSDFSFVQLEARAKLIHPFAGGRLLLRTTAGFTEVGEIEQLPVSVLYFAGGDASVRGYDYNSLGPEVNGIVTGGSNLLVTSIEYDYLIKPRWAVAAFFDQGNASNSHNFDFKRGAGMGVRWISPIGPVRIDVAKALDDDKGWALHLTMGPDL